MPKAITHIVFVMFSVCFFGTQLFGQGLPIPIGVGVPGGGGGIGVPDIPTNVLTDYPVPYANKAADYRTAYLIRAEEMGNRFGKETAIRSLFFEVEKAQQAPLFNFTIRIKHYDADSLTIPLSDNDLLTVFGPETVVERKGINEHRFEVPFCWDGNRNILVDICVQNPADDNSLNATLKGSVPDTTMFVSYHDWINDGSSLCDASDAVQPKLYKERPIMYWSFIDGDEVDLRQKNAPLPGAFMNLNDTQVLNFTFQNYGCEAVNNPVIKYQWNDLPVVTEQWPGLLQPGEQATHQFSQAIQAFQYGFNSLKIWTDDPNDVFRKNDTIHKLVWVKDTSITGLDYTGTDFWLGFMQNYDNGPTLTQRLFITSGNPANVNVSFPLLGWSTNITVAANQVEELIIPVEVAGEITATPNSEVISKTGLHVSSDVPISVYGYSGVQYTTDAFLAVPSRTIGTEYVVQAAAGIYNASGEIIGGPLINAPAEFLVVGTKANTRVTIVLTAPTENHDVGDTIQLSLNQGETYLVKAKIATTLGLATGTFDLSGTLITADKQVAVFSGSQCAMMPSMMSPNKCDACDHLVEQMTSTDTWGKEFYLTDFDYKPGNDILRITSSSDLETNLIINNSITVTLPPRGAYYDYEFNGNVSLKADAPISIGQYCTGAQCEPTSLTDPFYTNAIPVEQWGNFYTFSTPIIQGFDLHFINIIKKGADANVTLNSKLIDSKVFTPIPGNSDFYAGKIRVPSGSHIITADSIVSVYVYGFGRAESYGYPSSGSFLRRLNVDSIEVQLIQTPPSCNQTNDGSLLAKVYGGSAPYQFLWSTGDTLPQLSNIGEGTYWVKVTDLYGYSSTDTIIVRAPGRLETNMFASALLCAGDKNAIATVEITGGTPPYYKTWLTNPPSDGDSLFQLATGWYRVRVSDARACETIDSVFVEAPAPLDVSMLKGDASCFGAKDGVAEISASGGSGDLTIYWPNEDLFHAWSRAGMKAGVYPIEITDTNACLLDTFIVINEPTTLRWNLLDKVDDVCETNTGSIAIAVSGGTPTYQVSWSNGQNGLLNDQLEAGLYTFSLTDSAGCSLSDSVLLDGTTVPKLSVEQIIPASCEEGNGLARVNATGGDSTSYQYSWPYTSPAQTGNQAVNLSSGLQLVELNDGNCTDTLWLTIPFIAPPELSIDTLILPTCGSNNGEAHINVSGGDPPYTITWNTMPVQSGNQAVGLAPGSYEVMVEGNNCIVTEQINLSALDGPIADLTVVETTCGMDNGSVTASLSGGTGNYLLSWDGNTPDTVRSISSLASGWHSLLIDDGVCQVNSQFYVAPSSPPELFVIRKQPEICGNQKGTIELGAIGGTGNYTLNWEDTVLHTFNRQNLPSGSYMATVFDGVCSDSIQVDVLSEGAVNITLLHTEKSICGIGGSAHVKGTGGTGNYSWQWSHDTLLNNAVQADLPVGNYRVKLKDGSCTDSLSITITDSLNLNLSANLIQAAKCDLPIGSAEAIVNGGNGTYQLRWLGVDTFLVLKPDNMLPGFYNIEAIDGTCVQTDTLSIPNIPGPELELEEVLPQRCNKVNGMATVNIAEGSGVIWWDVEPKIYASTITNVVSGNYTVFINDGVCADSLHINIPYYQGPQVDIITQGASCDDDNGKARAEVSGGTPPYNYTWYTFPAAFDSIATELFSGNYEIQVSDQVCQLTKEFYVPDLGTPVVNPLNLSPSFCDLNNGYAEVVAFGGSGAYSYQWNTTPIQFGAIATNLAPGVYEVEVNDGSCTDKTYIEIEDKPLPENGDVSVLPARCNEQNGSILIIPKDETHQIEWIAVTDNGWQIQALDSGTYEYAISNEWCTDTFMVNVPIHPLAELSATIDSSSCGLSNGKIQLNPLPPYNKPSSVSWANGDTLFTRNNVTAGWHAYTWSDAYCQIIDSVFVPNIDGAELHVDSLLHASCGRKDGFIEVSASGGNLPITITWLDNFSTSPVRQNVGPGTYAVRLRDKHCVLDSTITVIDHTPNISHTKKHEYCKRENGEILINISGGTPPFIHHWSDSSVNTLNRNRLSEGSYELTVLDDRLCEVKRTISLSNIVEKPLFANIEQFPMPAYDGDQVSLIGNYPADWELLYGFNHLGDTIDSWPLKFIAYTGSAYQLSFVLESVNGCTDTIEYKLIAEPLGHLYIPTAFSPDGDGINEIFQIKGEGITKIEGGIYNRWGELIKTFEQQSDFWDGTFKGKTCKSDVYTYRFYVTDVQGNLTKAFGIVNLLR